MFEALNSKISRLVKQKWKVVVVAVFHSFCRCSNCSSCRSHSNRAVLNTHIYYLIASSVLTQGQQVLASVDGSVLYKDDVKHSPKNGFVALGTDRFGIADFDDLAISAS